MTRRKASRPIRHQPTTPAERVTMYLEFATDSLREMVSDGGLTPDLVGQVEATNAAFVEELNVAKASIRRPT